MRPNRTVLDNLFYGARPAAQELLGGFRLPTLRADVDVPHSSQALALDVFGTLKFAKSRDRICDHLAILLDVPTGGPWEVTLEYTDPDNLLHELQHKTQIDVVLRSRQSLIALECKFAETRFEPCGQTGRTGKGQIQCNGNYELQTNPANGRSGFCALSTKGIRYWAYIPRILRLSGNEEHRPCPIAQGGYQWMRTAALACVLAEEHSLKPVVGLVRVDRPSMPLDQRIRDEFGRLKSQLTGAVKFELLRYEKIPGMFEVAAEGTEERMFRDLGHWVKAKVDWVEARMQNARAAGRSPRR